MLHSPGREGVRVARSFDIASFEPGDGVLNEQLRRKLNGNFRRVCEMVGTESPAVVVETASASVMEQVPGVVEREVSDYMDAHLEDILGAALDRSWPVGSVIVTSTASDPRLSHGTWQQVGSGRYVRSAGDGVPVMSTGGSGEHLISWEELPCDVEQATHQAGSDPVDRVTATGKADQVPIAIEPEYLALLFYRRVS